jgi:Anaphase-promoting complex subunit 4 WD40 domain
MSSIRRIICLANSKKEGERCIAGIDIDTGKWVRPVCDSLYPKDGRVPKSICRINGREPELLDILEIPLSDTGNNFDFESENLSVLKGEWKFVGKAKVKDVIQYCDDESILHNSSKIVYPKYLQSLPLDKRKTLQLVNALSLSIKSRRTSRGGIQWLGTLVSSSGKKLVDIPITDPVFVKKIESGYQANGNYLITMSLGMPYKPDNWDGDEAPCWKLIAGVIEIIDTSVNSQNYSSNVIKDSTEIQWSRYCISSTCYPFALTQDNQSIVGCSSDYDLQTVKFCSLTDYKMGVFCNISKIQRINTKYFEPVNISKDGEVIAISSYYLQSQQIEFWNTVNGDFLYSLSGHDIGLPLSEYYDFQEHPTYETCFVEFITKDKVVIWSYYGIGIWEYGKKYRQIISEFQPSQSYYIACSEEFIAVVSETPSQEVLIFRVSDGEITHKVTTTSNASISCLVISKDSHLLVFGDSEGRLTIYDIRNKRSINSFTAHSDSIDEITFSDDCEIFATVSNQSPAKGHNFTKSNIKLWNTYNGNLVSSIDEYAKRIDYLRFNHDASMLIAGTSSDIIIFRKLDNNTYDDIPF